MVKSFDTYLVGGAVRDGLLGLPTKDYDYSVICNLPLEEAVNPECSTGMGRIADNDPTMLRCGTCTSCIVFALLVKEMKEDGFRVWQERPHYLTVRAHFPQDHPHAGIDADMVIGRVEGPYSDRRRPDWVKPASTLHQDLERRDFTVNAMARTLDTDYLIDPFDGQTDLANMTLSCVGSAFARFNEDPLRVIRAIRFRIMKGFEWDQEISEALTSEWVTVLVAAEKHDRIREELDRCFRHDTIKTMEILSHETSPELIEAIFSDGLRLKPTMEA